MNMHEHDDDFDLRISKRERLLPQFDAELDGPDADTDRVLLARARTASHPVQLRTPAAKSFRAPRWAVPVGLAATLVLSFTLLLHTAPPQIAAPASSVGESAAPQASRAEPVAEATARDAAVNDAAVSDSVVSDAAAIGSADRSRAALREMPAEIALEPAPAAKAMPDIMAAPVQAPAPPPPAPAMSAMSAAGSANLSAAESKVDAAAQRSAAEPLDPEAWLQRIETLRSRGSETEARRELQAFRQQYPDHPLPAALQALLPAP